MKKVKDAKPKLITANLYNDKKKAKNVFGDNNCTNYLLDCLTIEFKYIANKNNYTFNIHFMLINKIIIFNFQTRKTISIYIHFHSY